jgi:hypothetical protein
MGTYVRMTARPWNPAAELDGALERGDLQYAITLATEIATERGKPVDLDTALRFLPTVATKQRDSYDAWALRWLARWIAETPGASIDGALDVAAGLAALPVEPEAVEALRRVRPALQRASDGKAGDGG